MARLIDVDKIHWEYKCISKEEIDDIPTVKAIPIEWIKDYTRKNFPLVQGEIVLGFMADMLEDWEKENETTGKN